MKITCKRSDFHEALKTVKSAVSDKSTLPVLHNLLIQPGENEVTLNATDLELSICLRFPATVEDPAPLCLPAKTLAEFVNGLGEGDMTVEVDERNSGLVTQKKAKFKILGLPSEDFPPPPELKAETTTFKVSEANLHRVIRSVVFAASKDDTRPVLTGVHLSYSVGDKEKWPTLKFAATDTHRLAVRSCTVEPVTKTSAVCLLTARSLTELLKTLRPNGEGMVTVQFDKDQIRFITPELTMVSRLIAGEFPKYQRVIPVSHAAVFSVPVAELLSVVQRVAIVAKENSNKLYMTVKPGEQMMVVSSKSGEVGEIEDELQLVWEGDDEERRFVLNFQFLADVLSLRDTDTARCEVNGAVSPLLFRSAEDSDFLVVVMPMNSDV